MLWRIELQEENMAYPTFLHITGDRHLADLFGL
jgi:hypothetical protein